MSKELETGLLTQEEMDKDLELWRKLAASHFDIEKWHVTVQVITQQRDDLLAVCRDLAQYGESCFGVGSLLYSCWNRARAAIANAEKEEKDDE